MRLEGEGGAEMLWVLLLLVGTCCFFFKEFVCVCVLDFGNKRKLRNVISLKEKVWGVDGNTQG